MFWISFAHYVSRLFSLSLSHTFQFPLAMELVSEADLPPDEAAWFLAWTEFLLINYVLFFVGVAVYGIILLREIVFLGMGGRAAVFFSWSAHKMFFIGAVFPLMCYYLLKFPSWTGRDVTGLSLVGLPGLGACIAFFNWTWLAVVLLGLLNPRRFEKVCASAKP